MRPFIVFEGIDGTGKGTMMNMAIAHLRAKFGADQVVVTKDPGGTKLGTCIRRVMYEEVPTTEMAEGVVDLLFHASHRQNWLTIVKPALEAGKVVVSDRWWYSQAAYMTQRRVPKMIGDAYLGCHGDDAGLLIFLHGNPSASLDRARNRQTETHQSAKAWNDHDQMARIQQEYFDQFGDRPEFYPINIDGKAPPALWPEVREAIDRFMANFNLWKDNVRGGHSVA